MSEEEKKIRNNCYVDFYRAATWYYRNPQGNTHLVFFNHGMKLIRSLGLTKLISMCQIIQKKLKNSKVVDIRLADKILTVGLLVKNYP